MKRESRTLRAIMTSPLLPPAQAALLFGLWILYGLIHSALAARRVKAAVSRRWPAMRGNYRLAFNVLAVLLVIPPLALTYALAGPLLWSWSGVAAWLQHTFAALALGGFAWTGRHYDMREFLGLAHAAPEAPTHAPLSLSPLHRYVRHPWYFLALVLIWTRDMDAARLVSAVAITGYFWIGSRFEEAKLIDEYGEAYRTYRRSVGGLLPLPGKRLTREEAERIAAMPQAQGSTPFPQAGGGV